MPAEPLHHFVICRADLPYGLSVAQTAHAAAESAAAFVKDHGTWPKGLFCIVLSVPGETELLALAARLSRAEVKHVLFREPDPPYLGAATALGLYPGSKKALRRHLAGLSLLKGPTITKP